MKEYGRIVKDNGLQSAVPVAESVQGLSPDTEGNGHVESNIGTSYNIVSTHNPVSFDHKAIHIFIGLSETLNWQ